MVAILLASLAPRIANLLFRGVMWGDEINLALNVGPRGFFEMGRPFLHLQVAPWGSMALMKAVVSVVGQSDIGYRTMPLLASMAAVALAYSAGRQMHGRIAGLVAMAITGMTYWLCFYATECKPYALDAAFAALMALLCARVLDAPKAREPWIAMAVAGVAGAWTSLPSLFVLGGAGLAVFTDAVIHRRGRKHILGVIALGGLWIGAFAAHYQLFIARSTVATSTQVAKYWSQDFAPFPPTTLAHFRWYPGRYFLLFEAPIGLTPRYVAGLFFIFGLYMLYRRGKILHAVMLATPALLSILASAMGKYPTEGRLVLFIIPAAAIVFGVGFAELFSNRRAWIRWAGVGLLALLLTGRLGDTYAKVLDPTSPKELPHLLTELTRHYQEGDEFFMAGPGLATVYQYYGPEIGVPESFGSVDEIREFDDDKNFPNLPKVTAQTFGHRRLWLIATSEGSENDTRKLNRSRDSFSAFLRRFFDRHGGRGEKVAEAQGLELFLYDMSNAVPPSGLEAIRNPR